MNEDLDINFIIDSSLGDHTKNRAIYTFEIFCSVFEIKLNKNGKKVFYGHKENFLSDAINLSCDEEIIGRDIFSKLNEIFFFNPNSLHLKTDYGISKVPIFTRRNNYIDWISQSFEFLSMAYEYSVKERDNIGRIDYEKTLFGNFNLDPKIPYVSVYFNLLFKEIFGFNFKDNETKDYIAISHDVDFLPTAISDFFYRNIKNSIIQFLRKEFSLSFKTFFISLYQLFVKKNRTGNLELIYEKEKKLGVSSTYFFILSNTHRRDGNYTFEKHLEKKFLNNLIKDGNEIGTHGSYNSLFEEGLLLKELNFARNNKFDLGFRAHWLRFPSIEYLLKSLERNSMMYDSSIGFSLKIGFRSGANFPHPFYNFFEEKKSDVYLLPFAIMDGSLNQEALESKKNPKDIVESLLNYKKLIKKSGFSIIWHNTSLVGTEFSNSIKNTYWEIIKNNKASCVTCKSLVDSFKKI